MGIKKPIQIVYFGEGGTALSAATCLRLCATVQVVCSSADDRWSMKYNGQRQNRPRAAYATAGGSRKIDHFPGALTARSSVIASKAASVDAIGLQSHSCRQSRATLIQAGNLSANRQREF
jgi:hypothetical protein